MAESTSLEKEVESKFDVPPELDKASLMLMVGDMAVKSDWNLVGCRYEELVFQYFDTPQLDAYKNGDTVRRVSGFSANTSRHGQHRYDFKIGPVDNRLEKNHWNARLYSTKELGSIVQLPAPYTRLITSAAADTNHLKMFFEKEGSRIEVTQDIFRVREGTDFRELEIELQKGDAAPWRDLSERVRSEINLQPIHVQKYARVIEGMPKYRALF